MFEYRYVLFWDRNDNTQCIISGKKKCDRACVGVVDQNRGWLGTHYCIRRKIVTTAKNLSRIQICACERSVSNSVLWQVSASRVEAIYIVLNPSPSILVPISHSSTMVSLRLPPHPMYVISPLTIAISSFTEDLNTSSHHWCWCRRTCYRNCFQASRPWNTCIRGSRFDCSRTCSKARLSTQRLCHSYFWSQGCHWRCSATSKCHKNPV